MTEAFYTVSLEYESDSYYDCGMIDLTRDEALKVYNDLKVLFESESE